MEKNETKAKLTVSVLSKVDDIIQQHAWLDERTGQYEILQPNFENLQIAIADYVVPLLMKAGWFDGMLTGATHNHVDIRKRTQAEVDQQMQLKVAELQLTSQFAQEKLEIAIRVLRLMETGSKLLTPNAVHEIALKALDDMAGIGHPEAVGG